MTAFRSVIVYDLETTGLPQLGNKTRITEIALLGCEIQHLCDSRDFPRVLHKLVLCFNPNKKIDPQASELSGLTNELLENAKPFCVEDVRALEHFITRLPPPVCIVAHNGEKFDFPILQKALHNVEKIFPNDVYCADSLKAFRAILPKIKKSRKLPEQCEDGVIAKMRKKDTSFDKLPEAQNANQGASHSYKLSDIYQLLHNTKFQNAHRAEEDAQALLSCIMRVDEFFTWLTQNAVLFNTIKPLF